MDKGGATNLKVGGGSMYWKVRVWEINTVKSLTFEKGGDA